MIKARIVDTEIDMQRQLEPEVRTFTDLISGAIIWLRYDHRMFKRPRRAIDLDQQEFTPQLFRRI
jgi:hypothetical protein